jgi:hypothetical protein
MSNDAATITNTTNPFLIVDLLCALTERQRISKVESFGSSAVSCKTRRFPSHPHGWFGFVVGAVSNSAIYKAKLVPEMDVFMNQNISIGYNL